MNRTWQKLCFFASLYFVQGAAFAYAVNFQKPFLTARGLSKDTVGLLTSVLLIPFILKIVLGMLSDRVPLGRFGARKPYMILGLAAFSGCYAVLRGVEPSTHFAEFCALTFLASTGLALFDTCCDGWAVDVGRAEESGPIQASMVGGRSVGFVMMAGVFGTMASSDSGFSAIFSTLAILAAAMLLVVAIVPYRPLGTGQLEAGPEGEWRDFRELLHPAYRFFALYGVLYSIASFGTDGILTLHMVDTHASTMGELGLFGMYRGVGALVGAISFARFQLRYPLTQAVGGALILLGAGCLLPVLDLPLAISGLLWGFVWGLQETAFVTLAMGFARGAWAATFFAISMIFSNLGTALGEAIASPLVGHVGYSSVFVGFAVLAWVLAGTMPRQILGR